MTTRRDDPALGDTTDVQKFSHEEERLQRQTDEGAQELRHRSRELVITGGEWPEGESEGDTMIINMGPQHPSTHGVLRLELVLDGEVVVHCRPVIGYLHTGIEKTFEAKTYVQGVVLTDRMDYLNPLGNNLAYALSIEKLMGCEIPERATVLREGLERAGYEVAAALAAPIELLRAVEQVRPDVIIIDTDSPSRDVLEHVVMISRDEPRPIVMFSTDDAPETIRDAVRAGVSAYVVDGLDAARVKSIVEVAVARFDEYQRLRAELADANLKLSERKQVERAKGILMRTRGVGEDEAYQMLRRMAMDRGKRLGEIAQQLIDMADLLT